MRAILLDVFTDRALDRQPAGGVPRRAASVPEALRQDLAREIGFSETVYVDPAEPPDRPATAGPASSRRPSSCPSAGHPVLGTARRRGARPGHRRRVGGHAGVRRRSGAGRGRRGRRRVDAPAGADVRRRGPTRLAAAPPWGSARADARRPARGLRQRPDPPDGRGARPAGGGRPSPRPRPAGRAGRQDGHVGVRRHRARARRKTRMFVPGMGISEDPATGSASRAPLGVHLLRHGLDRAGRAADRHPGRRDPAAVDPAGASGWAWRTPWRPSASAAAPSCRRRRRFTFLICPALAARSLLGTPVALRRQLTVGSGSVEEGSIAARFSGPPARRRTRRTPGRWRPATSSVRWARSNLTKVAQRVRGAGRRGGGRGPGRPRAAESSRTGMRICNARPQATASVSGHPVAGEYDELGLPPGPP